MAEVRRLKFADGVTTVAPQSFSASTSSLVLYSDDAAFASSEGAPSAGSVYYNTTSLSIRVYDGSNWQDAGESSRTGKVALNKGDSSKTITFSSPWPDAAYIPVVSIENPDADPIFLNIIIQTKTVNGFSVKLNAAVDSNSYVINYRVSKSI